MSYTVEIAEQAIQDLQDIYKYIIATAFFDKRANLKILRTV